MTVANPTPDPPTEHYKKLPDPSLLHQKKATNTAHRNEKETRCRSSVLAHSTAPAHAIVNHYRT